MAIVKTSKTVVVRTKTVVEKNGTRTSRTRERRTTVKKEAPERLRFIRSNAKLFEDVWTFSLLSGHSCPFADKCLSKVVNGKIVDGPGKDRSDAFRCFSASNELRGNVFKMRQANHALMMEHRGSTRGMARLILASIPAKATIVRIHVGGDFFNQSYFDAWVLVARKRPDVHFYGYTKSLPYWVKRLGAIPSNMVLTASRGGRRDDLIEAYGLRESVVVQSEDEASRMGLPIDHDDSSAMLPGGSFALVIHGQQPKGSQANEAMKELGGMFNPHQYGSKTRENKANARPMLDAYYRNRGIPVALP